MSFVIRVNSPSLALLVPLWVGNLFGVSLFKGSFVNSQNVSKIRDGAPLNDAYRFRELR